MAEHVKLWSRADGSAYRNDGPINPVIDKEAARSMADAEMAAYDEHAKATAELAAAGPGVPSDLHRLEQIAAADPAALADAASERVRSNIGGQDIERGKQLFNLVELVPPQPPVAEQQLPPEVPTQTQ